MRHGRADGDRRAHGLDVIEDCAHAIETEYRGTTRPGTFGDFGCFSFYVTKNVTTGEGGMVLRAARRTSRAIKVLALHGMSKDAWKRFSDDGYQHYQVVEAGFKYNMMDLQAAIGIHQLERVEAAWRRAGAVWERYMRELGRPGLGLPADPTPGYRACPPPLHGARRRGAGRASRRDAFLDAMTAQGIGVGVHYLASPSIPTTSEELGWGPKTGPTRGASAGRPSACRFRRGSPDEDVDDVVEAIRRVIHGQASPESGPLRRSLRR